jgi:hypothetical protein
MVEFIYVSCMFNILLVEVKLNHVVMEQDFQRFIKLLSYTLGFAYLFGVKWVGVNLSVHIC